MTLHHDNPSLPIHLPSGRSVRSSEDYPSEAIEIRSPDGTVELAIRFTDAGPVLTFQSAALELKSAGDIAIDCESLAIRAKGAAVIEGGEVDVTATTGELRVTGATDAWVTAPMVLLNCDREEELAQRRLAAGEQTDSPARPCGCGSAHE